MAKEKAAKVDMSRMRTVGQLAQEWGVSQGDLRKKFKEAKVKPDYVKGGCSYYESEKMNQMRKRLGL